MRVDITFSFRFFRIFFKECQ
ncbi:hypothetical protein FWP52_25160 [Vibrio parahaemolyticus]|nr:hypothetical protein [Vibrio parahaemolyticus]